MGKTKQVKEKKFDRNVEISRPILDPEIIKAIHTPPKGQRLDIKHGGFKALLSDPNSQDSIDELTPLNDNHVPSYIGISCAVSGYSNYSSYSKKAAPQELSYTSAGLAASSTPNRSRTNSPLAHRTEHQINHITIDKNNIHSADEERRELTEKLTASATDRRRSPSPCIPPTEDDRHHGAYVGARYCPLPPPSKVVNKHIPLLGIDDEKDPDAAVEEDAPKVEQKIASLYGGEFVEDWRESMTHKSKKELPEDQDQIAERQVLKTPKDLVTLKPTPPPETKSQAQVEVDVPTPDVKVLAGVEKQFLNKLLTDENPPRPTPPAHSISEPSAAPKEAKTKGKKSSKAKSPSPSPTPSPVKIKQLSEELLQKESVQEQQSLEQKSQVSPPESPKPATPENLKIRSEDDLSSPASPLKTHDEHIEYEIRSQSPLNNESSPVRHQDLLDDSEHEPSEATEPLKPLRSLESSEPLELIQSLNMKHSAQNIDTELTERTETPETGEFQKLTEESVPVVQNLVSFSPEPVEAVEPVEQLLNQQIDGVNESLTSTTKMVDNMETLVQDVKTSVQDIKDSAEDISSFNEDLKNPIEDLKNPLEDVVEEVEDSVEEVKSLISEAKASHEDLISSTENIESSNEKKATEAEEVETKLVEAVEKLSPVSESNGGLYYLEVLSKEKSFILEQIERAQLILDEKESELDEDTLGRIRSAIGKANLLINKKCNQFKELCEANISMKAGEQYATLNDDLAGFWDMLSIQVSDVRKSFENLWQDEKNQWSSTTE